MLHAIWRAPPQFTGSPLLLARNLHLLDPENLAVLGNPDPAYLLRPPVRRAAPLRAVFLAVDFRLVAFLAVFRLVAFLAVFRLVVFLAVFRLVVFLAVFRLIVFLAVFRLIVFLAVFRADALRLLVAFFFFAGAMLTKPLQTLLVIINAANSTRLTKSKRTRPALLATLYCYTTLPNTQLQKTINFQENLAQFWALITFLIQVTNIKHKKRLTLVTLTTFSASDSA